jgi:hypothetical protein
MRPLLCLNLILLHFRFLTLPLAAQEDPNCFWQNSGGQTVDLSQLCGANAPKLQGRSGECRAFLQLMRRTMVADQIIQRPATRAQKNRNEQIAKKFDRSRATVQAAKFNDPAVRMMQEMAIDLYQDIAKYARGWNYIGANPTQNQGFAISHVGGTATLTLIYLNDMYQKTCGQKLAI